MLSVKDISLLMTKFSAQHQYRSFLIPNQLFISSLSISWVINLTRSQIFQENGKKIVEKLTPMHCLLTTLLKFLLPLLLLLSWTFFRFEQIKKIFYSLCITFCWTGEEFAQEGSCQAVSLHDDLPTTWVIPAE